MKSALHAAAIAAMAALAPATAQAQPDPVTTELPGGGELPDVQQEAGRDLTGLHRLLNSGRSEFDPKPGVDGRAAFSGFLTSVRTALAKAPGLAKEVEGGVGSWKTDVRELLLRGYLTRVQGRHMRDTLSQAVAVKTVGGPTEEFAAWLQDATAQFGLSLRQLGKGPGAAWEIVVGKGKRSVLLATHVDVEDTDPADWTHDPWAGKIVGRSVHGRGVSGGKAGLVAALYALRTLNDAQVPLKHTVRLFIGPDGLGARSAVKSWAKAHKKHVAAYVLGVPFAPVRGESGRARVRVTFPASKEPASSIEGWRVVSTGSSGPPRSVPTLAWAVVDPRGMPARRALGALRRNLTLMRKTTPEIQPEVVEDGEYVKVTFRGATQPAATPTGARNALADLGVFLADYVGLFPDHRGRLIRFLAAYLGHDTTCEKLGLRAAHRTHPDMPSATCAPVAIGAEDNSLVVDVRWPVGATSKDVATAVNTCVDELAQNLGGNRQAVIESSEPFLLAPDAPPLVAAMKAYKDLARRDPAPRTIPHPTYARHIRAVPGPTHGAVGFGPAPPGSLLHPGPNESLAIEDLEIAARTYLTLLLRLASN